ncbi:MAG: fibronectin type III domain-containing protein [Gemmatimonadales bacterium]|nr:fibronectin type III domain-containing protein [Gemmatimonadales bacterium]
MSLTSRFWRSSVTAFGFAAALGACGDDGTGPQPVPTPTGLAVQQTSLTSANVSWSAVTGATSYVLQRADANNPGVFAAIGGALTVTQYDDNGLTEGLAYSYRVAAVRAGDSSAFSTTVNFTSGLKAATINANITTNRTLYADTVYTLSGYIKVANGATLTIEAGTRILGDTVELGSSLWVLRGARIEANGTATDPIVFTSARAPGNRKPGDWGGLIIIGNGIINRTGTDIRTEGPAETSENYAGGDDNTDNSGTLRYVRIEFAGYDVSGGAGQELNALSSYAVGGGTTYEYIQAMAGLDDSFEYWGGAVDGRYLVSYESGDDHYDASEGYVGRNQFLIALQLQRLVPASGAGTVSSDPRGFEIDGCDPGVTGCTLSPTGASEPYTNGTFANFTVIGPGDLAGFPADGNGAVIRRGAGGFWANGILAAWKGTAINVRDAWTDSLLQQYDSLNIQGVLLAQNGANYDTTSNFGQASKFAGDGHVTYASDVLVDTLLGINIDPAGLDWTPKAGAPSNSGGVTAPAARVAGFFGGTWVNTTYLGAADPAGAKWWLGWTAYTDN